MEITQVVTPMMAQWHSCKEGAKDAILFFRLGDFYEAFYEDAEVISRELDLTLTKRQDVPMAGVPFHSAENYIDRLVARGYRVAIAEQIDDPKTTKGLVRRAITRIVTPGTLVTSSLLSDKESNYLAAIAEQGKVIGLALVDISTADLRVMEFEEPKALIDELMRLRPKELLLPQSWREKAGEIRELLRPSIQFKENWCFDHENALDFLKKQLKVQTLEGFGLKGMISAINAAGALLSYIKNDLNLPIEHILSIQPHNLSAYMWIDRATQRNLELTTPLREGQKEVTLLYLLDETKTPMGGRLMRHWISHPLLSCTRIAERQKAIEECCRHFKELLKLRSHLDKVRDLERLIMRIETGYASPRDLVGLRFSLEEIPHLHSSLSYFSSELLKLPEEPLPIAQRIASALVEDPPLRLSDGGIFKEGYDAALDELLQLKSAGSEWIANYQNTLRQQSGIKTLKVGYTQAFGYYIEVSRGALGKIPPHFHRRQTLVNAERYVTDELKEFEHKVLSASERSLALETSLFHALRQEVASYSAPIRRLASAIAQIDCLSSLALVAKERGYVRPLVDESSVFSIQAGRHPVIEAQLGAGFIPNDLELTIDNQLALITGPNMAGKSTFMRQAALIAMMAQIGSFVPAKSAHIGIIDKLFCRIGASDDLARGQSTFMVEMIETANILHNATARSLVILDEIGRGTSTYDGISIAWAVAETLLSTPGKQAKTLFATHYLEMTQLVRRWPAAFNLTVAVEETADEVIFLRKIIPGIADKSYGIHVARLAGLPASTIRRAEEKLRQLEIRAPRRQNAQDQLDLFS